MIKKYRSLQGILVLSSLFLTACQNGSGSTTGTLTISDPAAFPASTTPQTITVTLATSPSTSGALGFSNLTLHTTIGTALSKLTISPTSTCDAITPSSTATSCTFIVNNTSGSSNDADILNASGYYVTGQLSNQTVTSNTNYPGTEPPVSGQYWKITINNEASSNQYLFVFGQDPSTNNYGVVVFGTNNYGAFHTYSSTTQYGSDQNSIILTPGPNVIYIPYGIAGGRAYISNAQMEGLELTSNGGIVTPTPGTSGSANYNTIYDDFEFTYDTDSGNTAAVINQTAVDFLSTPICLQAPSTSYQPVQQAGYCNISRGTLLTDVSSILNAAAPGTPWGDLILKNGGTTLRIMNPGNSSETSAFIDYFSPYVTALATAYSAPNSLVVVSPDGTETVSGSISGSTYTFTDQNGNSGTMPLTSENLLVGAAPGGANAATTTAYQMVSSAFMAGQLPPTVGGTTQITETYLRNHSDTFYTQPTTSPVLATPYQYSVYSSALNTVGNNNSDPNIYTWAYDDVLGKSSTMTESLSGPSDEPEPMTVTVDPN